MNVNVLIEAIVRQTTVLIAQLATAAGLRAPLAQVANQVFVDLVRELKQQGLGNKVIADMFGLALSTYHDKVRRLSESRSVRGRSLWEATLAYIAERGPLTQAELLTRFAHDDEASVRGVLVDLTESGLVFRSGRGDRTTYRVARPDEIALDQSAERIASSLNLVWLAVHRGGSSNAEEIAKLVPFEPNALASMLDELVRDGRVTRSELRDATRYSAEQCVIPLGEAAGWEAALFDHYQAMVATICTKLRRDHTHARHADHVGGSTYGFTVWQGHPLYDEVLGFLGRTRREASALRARVRSHNAQHDAPAGSEIGVIAYVGQTVTAPDSDETQA